MLDRLSINLSISRQRCKDSTHEPPRNSLLLITSAVVSLLLPQAAIAANIDTRGYPATTTHIISNAPGYYSYAGQFFTPTADQTRLDRFTVWGASYNDSSV